MMSLKFDWCAVRTLQIALLLTLVSNVFAATDLYPFETQNQSAQFLRLTNELRCLVCQNQNLADSHAPLAKDLRDEVYQQILHGNSDKNIIGYLTERYGEFILYRPPLDTNTMILWFGPIILLLLGLFFLLRTMLGRGNNI